MSKRSKFSLSHYKLLTCDQGELVPVACMEVLPGDTFQQQSQALIRLSPMLAPVMHPVECRIHHWYVPTRLIWEDFEDFITGGPDGMNASVAPTRTSGTIGIGSLQDYMGVPNSAVPITYSMLPFRAYNLIYNEWYRDQDLQTEATISKLSGADALTSVVLQGVGWEKDYFTTARPWPQKGPDISIPLGTIAPVRRKAATPTNPFEVEGPDAVARTLQMSAPGAVSGTTTPAVNQSPLHWGPNINLEADLSSATAASINALREAFALQRYQEARARYGSRYTEYLRYLGIRPSDARLQRPEYLGGGRQTVQMSEVLQTTPNVAAPTTGVGDLKGHGISSMRSRRYRRFFEEHGFVISLMSVKPRTMYSQGLPRQFSRATKEDYFQKELQTIGQQEVLRKEIYTAAADPNGIFGYQDRYDEYRRQESTIAGEFRSTLKFWHMAREFSGEPTLNAAFVKSNPTNRIYAVTTTDQLWCMVHHSVQARRMLMPVGKSLTY